MTVGETMQLGPFTVRCAMRPDNTAFPVYLIFRGEKFIAKQFSCPSESDCAWHYSNRGTYAIPSESAKFVFSYSEQNKVRRGRPSNAERERRAAYVAQVEEEGAQ